MDRKNKIYTDPDGSKYVVVVPRPFGLWCSGMTPDELGNFVRWLAERAAAGDEDALKRFPFLATQEEMEAFEEGYSVSALPQ